MYSIAVQVSAYPPSPDDPNYPQYPQYPISSVVLGSLAGGAFILLCVFWCITLMVFTRSGRNGCSNPCRRIHLDDNRNYTLLSCCFWIVVIFFVSVTVGITVNAINIAITINGNIIYDDFGLSMSVAITMGCCIVLFLRWNLLIYYWIRKITGPVFCCC